MVVLLKKQDLNRKRKIIKTLLFVLMLGLLFSVVWLGLQNWATDFSPTNQTGEDAHPTIGPQSANVILNSGLSPSEALTAPIKYTISTDGKNTYASDSAQLVYGGPSDSGGVDGADATAVINAAVTSLRTVGGRIEVAEGDYLVNSTISLVSKVGLSCIGARFTLGFNGTMFEFAGVSDAALTGATIYGNRDNYAGTPVVLKDASGAGSSQNTVTNNHISYSGNRGISIENALSNFNNVSFNVVEDVAKEGIMISRSSYNLAYGNVVKNTGSHGIISTGGSYNQIINNRVENAGGNFVSGFAHGIAVDGNHGLNACYGVTVVNNTVNTAYMVGIEVADGAYYITVTNNYVTNTRESGIFFGGAFAASRNCIISQNTLYRCGTAGDQGILIQGFQQPTAPGTCL